MIISMAEIIYVNLVLGNNHRIANRDKRTQTTAFKSTLL